MSNDVAIGIDLGTSYCCVAYMQDGVPTVIPNEWGERTHAAVVSFNPDGSVLVGNPAKKHAISNAKNTVASAKRLIGRYFFSEEVKKARKIMPYDIVEGPNNTVRISAGGQTLTPPEVSALVLKELKAMAETHLGHPVTDAVITVPAFFNDNQRQATKDAGTIAGLNVLRILNEPTSAALAFGFGKEMERRIVVYDLGGGTFDVSILQLGADVFEVIATAGDTYLGGDDFDDRIGRWLAQDFLARHSIDLMAHPSTRQVIKDVSEKAKIDVGRDGVAQIAYPAICKGPDGVTLSLQQTLPEDQFNKMVMDLVQRTFKVCDEALQSAHLTASEIDSVILVGGPTRLPIVRRSVEHYFQKAPMHDIDPDEVVALGAAIQAGALSSGLGASHRLLDVTPLTLRIETVGGFTEKIIERNTPIPIEKSKTFTTSRDGQDRVKIRVYQGESNKIDGCESLGEFEFSGFRVALRGDVRIKVTFEIDSNGIVNVSATDIETGKSTSMTISLSSGMSQEEIAQSAAANQATRLSGHPDAPALA